jgi:type II secretory pathway pseudopilin PulG
MGGRAQRLWGLSLIEAVVVVVLMGVLAAVTLPRFSRASAGGVELSLSGNLAVMRKAIAMYCSEHGGRLPTAGEFASAMTLYTDSSGKISKTPSSTAMYGPYLREIPPLPVGAAKGSTGVAGEPGAGVGWIFREKVGTIQANTTTETDGTGRLYSAY